MHAWNCLNPTVSVQFEGRDYSFVWFGGLLLFFFHFYKKEDDYQLVSNQDPAAESAT